MERNMKISVVVITGLAWLLVSLPGSCSAAIQAHQINSWFLFEGQATANSQKPFPVPGARKPENTIEYSGTVTLMGNARLPIRLSWTLPENNMPILFGSVSLLDEDMPITLSSVEIHYWNNNFSLKYSRPGGSGFLIIMDNFGAIPPYCMHACPGKVYSLSRGFIGNIELSFVDRNQIPNFIKVASRTNGHWKGSCSNKGDSPADSRFPVELSIGDAYKEISNPVEYELPNSPGKIGTLKLSGYDYPIESCTIDYFTMHMHCVYSNSVDKTSLVWSANIYEEDFWQATLSSSLKGDFADCVVNREKKSHAQQSPASK
jgi:hypothetical protein